METGAITANIDVAQVTLYVFWVFFAGLVWYLRQEDRREGYPLEDDVTGRYARDPWLFLPQPKTFVLAHGHGKVSVPNKDRDTRAIAAKRDWPYSGSPLRPTGNPMKDGVGPASWAARADRPDVTAHGDPKIVPLRAASDFHIAAGETDPRGLRIIGCDDRLAGEVVDAWVDRSEHLIRYLEVRTGPRKRRTRLVPMNFCVLKRVRGGKAFLVHAITSEQFDDVPVIANEDQVTFLEEEKIMAYFGGGLLYATPGREESLL